MCLTETPVLSPSVELQPVSPSVLVATHEARPPSEPFGRILYEARPPEPPVKAEYKTSPEAASHPNVPKPAWFKQAGFATATQLRGENCESPPTGVAAADEDSAHNGKMH